MKIKQLDVWMLPRRLCEALPAQASAACHGTTGITAAAVWFATPWSSLWGSNALLIAVINCCHRKIKLAFWAGFVPHLVHIPGTHVIPQAFQPLCWTPVAHSPALPGQEPWKVAHGHGWGCLVYLAGLLLSMPCVPSSILMGTQESSPGFRASSEP